MKQTYKIIFQFDNKPIMVYPDVDLEDVVGLVDLHGKDMVTCQIEMVK